MTNHKIREQRRRLPQAHMGFKTRNRKFIRDVLLHTPIVSMTWLLIGLWLAFAACVYWGERGIEESPITSYGAALYWGIAAMSTAGIAEMPHSALSRFFGAAWMIVGSIVFFWHHCRYC